MKNNVSAKIMESMLKESQFESNEPGVCPACGEADLDYGDVQYDSELVCYYPWTCNQCGAKGKELYSMEFYEQRVD